MQTLNYAIQGKPPPAEHGMPSSEFYLGDYQAGVTENLYKRVGIMIRTV